MIPNNQIQLASSSELFSRGSSGNGDAVGTYGFLRDPRALDTLQYPPPGVMSSEF